MVKKLNDYLLTGETKHKHLVKVRSFSEAKISCMTNHVKPTLRDINLGHIILHSGTNDLRTENTASQIANARIMCRIPGAWHDSSTVIFTVEEFCQHRKKEKSSP